VNEAVKNELQLIAAVQGEQKRTLRIQQPSNGRFRIGKAAVCTEQISEIECDGFVIAVPQIVWQGLKDLIRPDSPQRLAADKRERWRCRIPGRRKNGPISRK
jgi:hypothetical protein